MKLAVMQPYFLPYLGYYQLVAAVDTFVFFDDVNFIKKGWINKNQILERDTPYKFSIPLIKASQNRLINEIDIADYVAWKIKFLRQVDLNYKKAPYFPEAYEWLNKLLSLRNYEKIADLAETSITSFSAEYGLSTHFIKSSEINYQPGEIKGGQEKIINICKELGADTYVNPKNGVELYNEDVFNEIGINLRFIHMHDIVYKQFASEFVPYLSILDVMMFNSKDEIKTMLDKYELK